MVCLNKFSKTVFKFARPIQVHTNVYFKILQFQVVTYDMGFICCAPDVVQTLVVYFLCLSYFLKLKFIGVHQSLLENAFSRIRTYVLRLVKG